MRNLYDNDPVDFDSELEDLFLNEDLEIGTDVDDAEVDDFIIEDIGNWWKNLRSYNIQKARKENPKYEQSHWGGRKNKIADFLHLDAIDPSSSEFSDAVFEWQTIYGFKEKSRDGILGPITWRLMRRCFISKSCRLCSKPLPASIP